jgi:hypothetical protein
VVAEDMVVEDVEVVAEDMAVAVEAAVDTTTDTKSSLIHHLRSNCKLEIGTCTLSQRRSAWRIKRHNELVKLC